MFRLVGLIVLTFAGVLMAAFDKQSQDDHGQALDASFIEPYTALFDFGSFDDEGHWIQTGTWSDQVTITEDGILERTVRRYPLGSEEPDLVRTITADRSSLLPQYFEQRTGPDLETVEVRAYDGWSVMYSFLQPSALEPVVQNTQFDGSVYELSLWATLAMSLPFMEGETVELPVFIPPDRSLTETFTVGALETIETPMGEYAARKVSGLNTGWVFWVRKDQPYIARIDHPFPDGSGIATSFPTRFEIQ